MIKLEEHKRDTENEAIEKMPLPPRVYISLSQHLGKICSPEVKAGDSVLTGQMIAAAVAHVYSPIHASVSGKIISIQDWPHPVLGDCKTIVIESDGLDKSQIPNPKPQTEINSLTAEQIRNIVFEAGIVGMGGASFPTHIKLNPPKPVDALIINGAECEPYLTADYRLMLEKTNEILQGIELAVRCLNAKQLYIAIEDNKPKAIEKFKNAIRGSQYAIRVLKSIYPQGAEKQLIRNILRREVPPGKLPFDVGVVVHNVATIFSVYEAVYKNKPLYERVVTVTGNCVSCPKNLLVRIGTPIKELIDFCGPLKQQPAKVIIGGPMMGIAQYSLDAPVVKSSNSVICLTEGEIESSKEESCVRCGRCIEYCPLGLMPCMISMASEKEKWDLAKAYGCLDCMECGLCNYICPQRRNIIQAVKQAKLRTGR